MRSDELIKTGLFSCAPPFADAKAVNSMPAEVERLLVALAIFSVQVLGSRAILAHSDKGRLRECVWRRLTHGARH